MARQAGVDPAANPAAPYVLRLFGVRTVLIGLELLRSDGAARRSALDRGVLIHASDTASAAAIHPRLRLLTVPYRTFPWAGRRGTARVTPSCTSCRADMRPMYARLLFGAVAR